MALATSPAVKTVPSEKPFSYAVVDGGITHSLFVGTRLTASAVHSFLTPVIAAGVDFAHLFPELLFTPFFWVGKGIGHGAIGMAQFANMAAGRSAHFVREKILPSLPESGKTRKFLAEKLGWVVDTADALSKKYRAAHQWVKQNLTISALGKYVTDTFKKAEEGLFHFGARRSPLGAFATMMGIVTIVAPLTFAGGVIAHALSFMLLNGSTGGVAVFLGVNASATLLPKFKLFLAPLYMGCTTSLLRTEWGKKSLSFFNYAMGLDLAAKGNAQFNSITEKLSPLTKPFRWNKKWKQRLGLISLAVATTSVSLPFAAGLAAVVGLPIAIKYGKDRAIAALQRRGWLKPGAASHDASDKLGHLLMHTLETYTFQYYYKKNPALFNNAPKELLDLLNGSSNSSPEDPSNNRPAAGQAPAAGAAATITASPAPQIPATETPRGSVYSHLRAFLRTNIIYNSGFFIATPLAAAGGALAYKATYAPATFLVGKPLEALIETLTHHGSGHFAESIGNLVAGTLAIPGVISGAVLGLHLARKTARYFFSPASNEICSNNAPSKNAEARLLTDGLVTSLACLALTATGFWPAAVALSIASYGVSIIKNHVAMKETFAQKPPREAGDIGNIARARLTGGSSTPLAKATPAS